VVVIPPQTKSKNTRFTDNGTGTPDGIATPQINGCCTDRMNPPEKRPAGMQFRRGSAQRTVLNLSAQRTVT
ncbi:hypothetical protein JN086_05755, partial [Mycolicibacterium austroafricanum]|uniref:hypothetical protein n=1 Tax=Mycolicibacterium austroafricanum TaxID=39687 RepID=UPI001ABF6EBA